MYSFLGIVLLLMIWGLSKWRDAVEEDRITSLSQMREVGALNQRESQPYLVNDGGRGPGGGRIVRAAPLNEGSVWYVVFGAVLGVAGGIAGILSLYALPSGGDSGWMFLVFSIAGFIVMGFYAERVRTARQFMVEVDPFPAAIGGSVVMRLFAPGRAGYRATYHIRLIQRESKRDVNRKGDPWRHTILWSSPMLAKTVTIGPTGLIGELTWELPDGESGTFKDRNYELTWGIQIGCRFGDSMPLLAELYAFPVVQ